MSETEYKHFIQYLAAPLTCYLFVIERFNMLCKFDCFVLKESNYTFRIDATGGIVQPLQCANKRIFLYSIIAHFPTKEKYFQLQVHSYHPIPPMKYLCFYIL